MIERYSGVNLIEKSRVRCIESDGGLIVPDKTMHKQDLPRIFDGQDIELLVEHKLKELGFVPRNEEEGKMLSLLENPLIHRYPTGDSPARYFLEVIMGKDALLASYLPPKSITHPHPHSKEHGILEDYYHIGGESYLHLDGDPSLLTTFRRVPLDTYHQLEARDKPAFTLIIMKNAGIVERRNWHK